MNGHPDPSAPSDAPPVGPRSGPAPGQAPQPAPRHGTVAWALGFLAYIPIPIVGMLVAGITQLIVGLAQRKHGGLAAVNGVRAANWGLMQLCWPVLMVIIVVIGVATGEPTDTGVVFAPVMNVLAIVMACLFFVIALLEAVYAIVGTVQASRGREVRLPVIPFLRAPRG
jgi:uncharacterized Tic20 family protein